MHSRGIKAFVKKYERQLCKCINNLKILKPHLDFECFYTLLKNIMFNDERYRCYMFIMTTVWEYEEEILLESFFRDNILLIKHLSLDNLENFSILKHERFKIHKKEILNYFTFINKL
jgi:hypothetical protein